MTTTHRLAQITCHFRKRTGTNEKCKSSIEQLTGNMEREKLCWEETNLKHLRERRVDTGLTDYICEVEERLAAILWSD